jgi:hypothetical protein
MQWAATKARRWHFDNLNSMYTFARTSLLSGPYGIHTKVIDALLLNGASAKTAKIRSVNLRRSSKTALHHR